VFPWLVDTSRSEDVKSIVISGDVLDAKDYHSATLVNRVTDCLVRLRDTVEHVYVLMGNHDYLIGDQPYLRFLNHIPGISYIWKPQEDHDVDGPPTFFLPHTKHPARDWAGMDFSHYQYLFMHQTLKGAIASSGTAMEGEEVPELNAHKVFSGDIHVPQLCGPLEYIGSPYHVHFGDKYEPRIILLDRRGRQEDLEFATIARMTLTVESLRELKRLKLRAKDQVKLRMKLTREEHFDWQRIRREATGWLADQGVVVAGVELIAATERRRIKSLDVAARSVNSGDAVLRYVEHQELGADALDIGYQIVEGV